MKLNDFSTRMMRNAPDADGGAPPADAAPADTAPPSGPDLSFLPADFVKDGTPDLAAFATHYQELAAAHAARPTPPEEYAFDLPEDFSPGDLPLPEGMQFSVDTKDEAVQPLLAEMAGILKSIGAPAEAATGLMGVLAKYEAVRESRKWSEFQQDVQALGGPEKFQQRFSDVERALQTRLSKDEAAAILQGPRISSAALKALGNLLAPRGLQPPASQPKPVDPLAARYPRSA